MRMKLLLPTMLITLLFGLITVNAQNRGHKSEPDIARMTPAQRVDEYFREYLRHGLGDFDYRGLLLDHIFRDGVAALSPATRAIDDYDPRRHGSSGSKWDQCDDATALLPMLDSNIVRLRASDEGRQAIEAMRRLSERMRASGFDSPESDYPKQSRYKYLMLIIRQVEGINDADEAIRNSLRINHGISLSDQELLLFVNYLISKDPAYPGWSKTEKYRDPIKRNQAGNPLWYDVMKDPQPFYKEYLQFSSTGKKPD
jgi:hypothetical protein